MNMVARVKSIEIFDVPSEIDQTSVCRGTYFREKKNPYRQAKASWYFAQILQASKHGKITVGVGVW